MGFKFVCKAALAALIVTVVSAASTPRAQAARCELISGTATGTTKEYAVQRSREGLEQGIAERARANGWKRVTARPHPAKPNPFFRDRVITPDLMLKPDVRDARAHSVCWTGVVAPAVCTSGAWVCGN